MNPVCAERVLKLPHSGIRRMFDLALRYKDAIHLCIGEPDFATPSFIVEAGFQAAKKGRTHYTPNAGFFSLREAVAEKYEREQGVSYDPESEILITVGAMEALALCMLSIVSPGDEVLIPDPCWPNYQAHVILAGGKPVFVPVVEEEGWVMKMERMLPYLSTKTRAVIINSPNNPTGSVYKLHELEKIANLCKERNIFIISDEAYEKIIYEGEYKSICSFPGLKSKTFVINTFSKTYAMTGWRVGYILGPEEVIREMVKLQEHIAACASSISQEAALVALQQGDQEVRKMVKEYRKRRDALLEEIDKVPLFSCFPPRGTFYAFVNIKKTGEKSEDFALKLLEKARVVTVPGSSFGPGGEGYLRFSFATSVENIKEAFHRIRSLI